MPLFQFRLKPKKVEMGEKSAENHVMFDPGLFRQPQYSDGGLHIVMEIFG